MILDKFNRPLKDLRISVTDRCNFRCNYCMPADVFDHDYVFLHRDEILTFEETARIAGLFVQLGVSKIRLTGGEPLLRHDLELLVQILAQMDGVSDLALTTNGSLLKQKAEALRRAGLKRITVSLDTLNPDLLKETAGKHLELQQVLEGIKLASRIGFVPIKINAVIQKGVNDGEIKDLLQYAKANGHIMRFIEYMDVGNLNGWRMDQVVPAQEIVELISREMAIEPLTKSYPGEVSNRYRFSKEDGEFGVIASVSQPFCGDCTRVRLSADGKLFTCLFASEGVDLKEPMRAGATDAELSELLTSAWNNRDDRYSEERTSQTRKGLDKKIEMYQIGG